MSDEAKVVIALAAAFVALMAIVAWFMHQQDRLLADVARATLEAQANACQKCTCRDCPCRQSEDADGR